MKHMFVWILPNATATESNSNRWSNSSSNTQLTQFNATWSVIWFNMRHQLTFSPTRALYVIIHHKRYLPAQKLFAFLHSAHAPLLPRFATRVLIQPWNKQPNNIFQARDSSLSAIVLVIVIQDKLSSTISFSVKSNVFAWTKYSAKYSAIILPPVKVLSG